MSIIRSLKDYTTRARLRRCVACSSSFSPASSGCATTATAFFVPFSYGAQATAGQERAALAPSLLKSEDDYTAERAGVLDALEARRRRAARWPCARAAGGIPARPREPRARRRPSRRRLRRSEVGADALRRRRAAEKNRGRGAAAAQDRRWASSAPSTRAARIRPCWRRWRCRPVPGRPRPGRRGALREVTRLAAQRRRRHRRRRPRTRD